MYFRTLALIARSPLSIYPGMTSRSLKMKVRMWNAGIQHWRFLSCLLTHPEGKAFHRALGQRPHLLGALIWPYQCSSWEARERLRRTALHYHLMSRIGAGLGFGMTGHIVLASLDDLHPGARVILDQSRKFMREGGLVLHLFVEDQRIYSIAFSLYQDSSGRRSAVVGNLQGRNLDEALDLYRDLTKKFHGIRPRDLMVELLRSLCRTLGIDEIHGVSDDRRVHKHDFFGRKPPIQQSYDEVWIERGGTRISAEFFALSSQLERRDLAQVKPNKRSMYRRRYAFLDDLEGQISAALGAGQRPLPAGVPAGTTDTPRPATPTPALGRLGGSSVLTAETAAG